MGIKCVDKPLGLTSHDVVARARRLLGTRRVGHAGTLDPLATGVLLLLVDEATKLSNYLTGHDKSYLAWVSFGAATPTLDAEGPVSATADASGLDSASVEAALAPFLALSQQAPPAYSAIKRAGERSYAAARRGEASEPPPRPVSYRAVELLAFGASRDDLPRPLDNELPAALGEHPTAMLALSVSAGTYVRAFARDLGAALGLPAHLSGLVRTASGGVTLAQTGRLDDLGDAGDVPVLAALGLPVVALGKAEAAAVVQGRREIGGVSERSALVDGEGRLVALADPGPDAASVNLLRVFPEGI